VSGAGYVGLAIVVILAAGYGIWRISRRGSHRGGRLRR
jgi:hypothetical protein